MSKHMSKHMSKPMSNHMSKPMSKRMSKRMCIQLATLEAAVATSDQDKTSAEASLRVQRELAQPKLEMLREQANTPYWPTLPSGQHTLAANTPYWPTLPSGQHCSVADTP